MNRLIFRKSVIFITVLFISVLSLFSLNNSVTAYEAINSGMCGDNATYTLYDNGVLEISGEGNIFDYTPSTIPWSAYFDGISSVVIGDKITGIGASAFYNIKISSIEIPSSINYIGGNSIGYTSEGKIPNFAIIGYSGSYAESYAAQNGFNFSVKPIDSLSGKCGSNLNWQLSSDGTLTVTGTGEMYTFASFSDTPWSDYASEHNGYQIKSVVISDGVLSIGNNAFKGCREIKTVTLPSSLKKISVSAFENCSSLTSIAFPLSLSEIQDNAFLACSSLGAISFSSETQLEIGNSAFSLTALKTVTLPSNVTSIGTKAFYGCGGLEDVKILAANTVADRAFASCTLLKSVALPSTLKSIENSTFEDCSALTQISIPVGVEKISSRAFYACTLLSKISLPDTVITVGEYAFAKCSSLSSATIGNSLEIIEEGAFEDCIALSEVKIGQKVNIVSERAFLNCPSLKKITLPSSLNLIAEHSIGFLYSENQNGNEYSKCSDFIISSYSPSQAEVYAKNNGFDYQSLGQVETAEGYISDEVKWYINTYTGVVMITGNGRVPDYVTFSEAPWSLYSDYIKTVVYGSGIFNVGVSSFEGCKNLSSLSISSTVSEIGESAFAGTSLTTLTLPNGVIKIHDSAFENCSSLNTLTLPETLEHIGPNAFKGAPLLKSVYIPASVTFIGSYSFGFDVNDSLINDFVLRGNKNSTAEHYAFQHSIPFREDGHIEIKDESSDCTVSVLGSSSNKFVLSFNNIKNTLEPDIYLAKNEYAIVYEILLTEYDLPAQIEGAALISFSTPENVNPIGIKIFHMSADGKLTEIDFTANNGRISFYNTSFGKYIITNADLNVLYNITVNYQFEDGKMAAPSAIFKGTANAQYQITSAEIDGYVSTEETVVGTVNGNATVLFTYKPASLEQVTTESDSPDTDDEDSFSNAKIILIVVEIILIVGIIAGALALFLISRQRRVDIKNKAPDTNPIKPQNDKFSDTIIVPDAPTREIDVTSLFANDPEEDKDAENSINKSDKNKKQ